MELIMMRFLIPSFLGLLGFTQVWADEHPEERYRAIEELVLEAVRDHQIEPGDASDVLGHLRELFAEGEHAEEEREHRGHGTRGRDVDDDLGEHERNLQHAHREMREAIESGRISPEEGREKLETMERHARHQALQREWRRESERLEEAVEEGDLSREEGRKKMEALEREMLGMHMKFKREEVLNWIRDAERSGELSKEEARQKREELEKEFREDRERREREEIARKEREGQETPRRGSADREGGETRERGEGGKGRGGKGRPDRSEGDRPERGEGDR